MLVTRLHLEWWRSKHEPTWGSKIKTPRPARDISIHALINAQCHYPHTLSAPKEDTCLHNTLALLRNMQRRGDLRSELRRVRDLLESPHSTAQRRVWCDRFLRKLRKARKAVGRV